MNTCEQHHTARNKRTNGGDHQQRPTDTFQPPSTTSWEGDPSDWAEHNKMTDADETRATNKESKESTATDSGDEPAPKATKTKEHETEGNKSAKTKKKKPANQQSDQDTRNTQQTARSDPRRKYRLGRVDTLLFKVTFKCVSLNVNRLAETGNDF